MSTIIKIGWLNDKNGDKFAPKTLTSQVQTSDGVLIEDKINNDLNEIKTYIDSKDVFVATYDVTTYQEVVEAHNAGRIVQVRDAGGIIYPLCVCSEEDGQCLFLLSEPGMALVIMLASDNTWSSMEMPYASAEELNAHVTNENIHFTSAERTKLNSIEEGANKLEPLVGTTAEITPTQVAEAVIAGRPISISHTYETFGEAICNYANIVPDHNSVILSGIGYFGGQFIILELLGFLGDNTWTVFSTTVAEKEYIDNALAEKSNKNHDHDNIYQSKLCEITEEVILSETTVDTITGQGYITCDLEDDVYYQICYNGTNYITKCVRVNLPYLEYKLVVGNTARLIGTGDNGIPFSISNHVDNSGAGYTTVEIYDDSSPSSTTISVSKINYSKIASSVIPTIEEMRSKTNLLFPLTDVSGSYDESLSCYWSSIGEFSIINGQTYKVTFDGVEYTRIASIATMAGASAVAIGNKLVAGGEDTGEPFALFSMNGFAGMIFLDSNDHAVQIEHEIIQKIPAKFIPNITELCSSEIDIYNGTVEIDTNGEGYVLGNFDNTIVAGGTYKVKWNNIEYRCIAIDASSIDPTAVGIIAFGNIDMLLETGDTGEPFIALYLPSSFTSGESGIRFGVLDGSTGNVQVSIKSIKIEALPKECIPPLDALLYDAENVLPTTELNIDVNGEASIAPAPFTIIPNDEYIIKFNGDIYTCVAGTIDNINYVGNLHCIDHDFTDNGLPFLLLNGLNSDGERVLFVASTYTDQVVSISVDHIKHYVKIPEECLPDYDSDYESALNDAKEYTDNALNGKVDKVDGKGLSTNDFTTDEKNKLASIPTVTAEDNGAFLRVVNGVWSVEALSNAEEVGF